MGDVPQTADGCRIESAQAPPGGKDIVVADDAGNKAKYTNPGLVVAGRPNRPNTMFGVKTSPTAFRSR
jgi:hypothetical protein